MSNNKIKSKWWIFVVLALVLVVVIVGVLNRERFREDEKLNVNLIAVDMGDVSSRLSTTGYISCNNVKQYFGQGIVSTVYIKRGDKVEKGQVLVKYENGQQIKSDISGTITYLSVSPANFDTGGAPAVIVEDLNDLKVTVSVGKNSAPLLKVGQVVEVTQKDISFQTTVDYVSPTAQSSSGSFGSPVVTLEYALGEYSSYFISGFDLDADILIDHVEDVLRAPVEAVYYSNNRFFVYTVNKDNVIEEVVIEIGLLGDNYVEVLSGLNQGDKIVITQSSQLTSGLLVNPMF